MKIAALLASAFVATAVQASQVPLYYCIDGDDCHNAPVENNQCTNLEYPGTLTSIQNGGDCLVFEGPYCRGPDSFFPRGSHDQQDFYVQSVKCFEQRLARNLAPAVQAEDVEVLYCLEDLPCVHTNVEPFMCANLEEQGRLDSIQNGADCLLYEEEYCVGRNFLVKRGAHDASELHGRTVGSLRCFGPGLRRNPAPVVQAADVTVTYCLAGGPCIDQPVESFQCTRLIVPGSLSSIQNNAQCELYTFPGCSGRSIVVPRGSSDHLQTPVVYAIMCSEPGFQRNQRPMRRH